MVVNQLQVWQLGSHFKPREPPLSIPPDSSLRRQGCDSPDDAGSQPADAYRQGQSKSIKERHAGQQPRHFRDCLSQALFTTGNKGQQKRIAN